MSQRNETGCQLQLFHSEMPIAKGEEVGEEASMGEKVCLPTTNLDTEFLVSFRSQSYLYMADPSSVPQKHTGSRSQEIHIQSRNKSDKGRNP